jgi:hypothetical protein
MIATFRQLVLDGNKSNADVDQVVFDLASPLFNLFKDDVRGPWHLIGTFIVDWFVARSSCTWASRLLQDLTERWTEMKNSRTAPLEADRHLWRRVFDRIAGEVKTVGRNLENLGMMSSIFVLGPS